MLFLAACPRSAPAPRDASSIVIVETRETKGHVETRFGIVRGREDDAGLYLRDRVQAGEQLDLRNDEDEGREGVTFFRFTAGRYETKKGGQGWQSRWPSTCETCLHCHLMSGPRQNRMHRRPGCAGYSAAGPELDELLRMGTR